MHTLNRKRGVIPADANYAAAYSLIKSLRKYRLNFSEFPQVNINRTDDDYELTLSIGNAVTDPLILTEQEAVKMAQQFRNRQPIDYEIFIKISNLLKSLEWHVSVDRQQQRQINN